MKNLILIRHGKSSWDAPLHDKDRPLARRGIQDTHHVANHAISFLPKKNIIWSSTAKRASETAIIFAQNLSWPIESIQFKDELYTFDVNILLHIIKLCSDDYENVIIFGHNAAITEFVNKFGDVFIDNVPTTGFVSIAFNTNNWSSIIEGKVLKTIFPRDLK